MRRTVLDPASEDGVSRSRPTYRGVLRRAAERAMHAPSVHNTQPWRFVVTAAGLDVLADDARRLDVVDPNARQLTISCGCAVFNARTAVAAAGFEPVVTRFPDPQRPELIARIAVGRACAPGRFADLERAIERRRTNRRPYVPEQLPAPLVADLLAAARAEGAGLLAVAGTTERGAVLDVTAAAAAAEQADPAYRAELEAWTTDDLRRPDGVQAASVPYAAPDARENPLMRPFDTRGMGWLPEFGEPGDGALFVLWTHDDDRDAWLHAGEALEHVWLEVTARGMWASPVSQPVELGEIRDELRHRLHLAGHPQLVLRVGLAAETVPSRRRPAHEVITERDSSEPNTGGAGP